MTNEKRITFVAPEDVFRWLKAKQEETGAPLGEIIRRAIRKTMGPPAIETRNSQPKLLALHREDERG